MRDLFIVLLTYSELNNPRDLWERFKDAMSQDYLLREQIATNNDNLGICDRIHNHTLIYLQQKLDIFGKKLIDFNVPPPQQLQLENENNINNRELLFEQQYDREEQSDFMREKEYQLNDEQRNVYNFVCECLDNNESHLIYIDAPGGTGKTFLVNTILARVRSAGNIAIAVASSGIAATLMPGGRTAHSRFKLPLTVKDDDMCNFDKNSMTAELFRKMKVIVWDECPMMRRESFEATDRTLQDVRNNSASFGGIFTICCGDFRQLLPVVKKENDADIENACIKKSYLWRHFAKFQLTQNMRLDEDGQRYAGFLTDVGEDKLPKNNDDEIELPETMVLAHRNIEESLAFVYLSFDNPTEVFSHH